LHGSKHSRSDGAITAYHEKLRAQSQGLTDTFGRLPSNTTHLFEVLLFKIRRVRMEADCGQVAQVDHFRTHCVESLILRFADLR